MHLAEQHIGGLAEIKGVAEDLDAGLADDVAGWCLVALGINEVAFAEAEDGAVGEELIQVGVRVPGGLLGLVLGVDDGDGRAAYLPDDVGPEHYPSRLVKVMPVL